MTEINCPHCGKDIGDADLAEYRRKREINEIFKSRFSGLIQWRQFFRNAFIISMLAIFPIATLFSNLVANIYFLSAHLMILLIIGASFGYCDFRLAKEEKRLYKNS